MSRLAIERPVVRLNRAGVSPRLDGGPSAGLAVFLLPGANALDTADRAKAKMRKGLPESMSNSAA